MKYLMLSLLLLLPMPSWATKPTGIISLDLCTDWMLQTYADPADVLAFSPYSKRFPLDETQQALPTHDGSLEHILSLEPDMVLSGEFNAPLLRQRLVKLGYRVEVLPLPKTLQQVEAYEKRFLQLLGLPETRATLPVGTAAQADAGAPRLLLLGANAGGTGTGTLEHEILARAGWRNYVREPGYVTLDLEHLVKDPPDAVMWSAPVSRALANNFYEHPALRKAIPKDRWLLTDYGKWQCQGPWTWQRVKQLQQARQLWDAH